MSDLRKTLSSAYTFIRSVELNKATSSLTLDHIIQDQIKRLKKTTSRSILDAKGDSVGNRISYLDSLDALEKDLEDSIKAVQDAGSDPEKLKAIGIFAGGGK